MFVTSSFNLDLCRAALRIRRYHTCKRCHNHKFQSKTNSNLAAKFYFFSQKH